MMYAQDYDETCPYMPQTAGGNFYLIMDLINQYIKNAGVWVCPSGHFAVVQSPTPPGGGSDWSTFSSKASYGYNDVVGGGPGPYTVPMSGPPSLAYFLQPANTMVFCEANLITICYEPYRVAYPVVCGSWLGCDYSALATPDNTLHNGGNNIAFVDGHAKWMNASDIIVAAGGGPAPSFRNGGCAQPFWGHRWGVNT